MNLFNRTITVSVETKDKEHVSVNGIFIDSNHELVLRMTVNVENFIVTEANGHLRRAPYKDCIESKSRIENLVGINLHQNVRRQVRLAVGGEKGCTHFEELAIECIKGIKQAKFTLMKSNISAEEIHSQLYDLLEGTCTHYHSRKKPNNSEVAR